MGKPYSGKVDWWCLGCVSFIKPPWPKPTQEEIKLEKGDDWEALLSSLLNMVPTYDPKLSREFQELVSKLLEIEPDTRFGAEEIRKHPFCKGIYWEGVRNKSVKPAYCPSSEQVHFSPVHVLDDVFGVDEKDFTDKKLTPDEQTLFSEWNWTNPKYPKGLTSLEEDLCILKSTPNFPQGFRVFPCTDTKIGKVYFSLKEFPLQVEFLTERGNRLERINEKQIKLGRYFIDLPSDW